MRCALPTALPAAFGVLAGCAPMVGMRPPVAPGAEAGEVRQALGLAYGYALDDSQQDFVGGTWSITTATGWGGTGGSASIDNRVVYVEGPAGFNAGVHLYRWVVDQPGVRLGLQVEGGLCWGGLGLVSTLVLPGERTLNLSPTVSAYPGWRPPPPDLTEKDTGGNLWQGFGEPTPAGRVVLPLSYIGPEGRWMWELGGGFDVGPTTINTSPPMLWVGVSLLSGGASTSQAD